VGVIAALTAAACGSGGTEPTVTPVPTTPTPTPEARASIDGHWEGTTLYRSGNLITMVYFEIVQEGLKGTLDFPDIGREGLVLSNISFEPPKVHFELSEFGTVFDGELEGDTISGEFVDPDGVGHFSLERQESTTTVEDTEADYPRLEWGLGWNRA